MKGTRTTFFKSFSLHNKKVYTDGHASERPSDTVELKGKHPSAKVKPNLHTFFVPGVSVGSNYNIWQKLDVYMANITLNVMLYAQFRSVCNGGIDLEKSRWIGPMGRFVSHRRIFGCNEWRSYPCRFWYIHYIHCSALSGYTTGVPWYVNHGNENLTMQLSP